MATAHVEIYGLHLYGTAAHRPYLDAVLRGEREVLMADLFRRSVGRGALVLDVGAFVGYFALLAGRAVGPEGRVFAFEPDPRDRPWLSRNVEANALGDRVEVVPFAASDRPGRQTLYLAEEDRSQSSLYPTRDGGPPTEVEAVTVDAFLGGRVPHLVKIDVEGAELRALDGMGRSIERGRPTLFIEWNPGALRMAGVGPDELPRRLEELGYRVELIDEDRRRLAEPVFPEGKTYVNLYCVPVRDR